MLLYGAPRREGDRSLIAHPLLQLLLIKAGAWQHCEAPQFFHGLSSLVSSFTSRWPRTPTLIGGTHLSVL